MKKSLHPLVIGVLVVFGFVRSSFASNTGSKAAFHPEMNVHLVKFDKVRFDSLATKGFFARKPEVIDGYLLKSNLEGKSPAVIVRPPCHGMLLPKLGVVRVYDQELAKKLHKAGFTVLLVDGFTPRGKANICQTPAKQREITRDIRIKDTIGALKYLESRDDIDASRIFLVTFGANGGFDLLNRNTRFAKAAHYGFAGAAMFYPECAAASRPFSGYAPIDVFVGDKDAWNPPAFCKALVKQRTADSAPFILKIYPNTYHAFANKFPPRFSQGPPSVGRVMTGNNPKSVADAYRSTVELFASIGKE